MNDKSHVSLEQQVCVVCGTPFDTGNILLDRRLRPTLERNTVTGWGMCVEHERLRTEGFVALVECDPRKSGVCAGTQRLQPERAYRTGRLAHLKREVFAQVFNGGIDADQALVFVEIGVIDHVQRLAAPER